MTAFHPIAPGKALEFVEAAGVPEARRILADFAAAGVVKTYALSIETVEVDGKAACVRQSAVPAELWRRIISEGAVEDVWLGGTVRLKPADLIGGAPEVRITGMGFGEKHLQRVVDHHRGPQPKAPPPPKAASIKAEPASVAVDPPAPAPQPVNKMPSLAAIPDGALLATVKQAQAALGFGRTKINELMNDGTLVRRDIGRAVRIEVASIQALAQSSATL